MSEEIVIIGGGLAGAAAAAQIAAEGRDVLLLEKETAPIHKVCGEFISWNAVRELQRLGVDLPGLGAASIDYLMLGCGGASARLRLPGRAASLSRFCLDEALLGRAVACGAKVQRGVVVTALAADKSGWRLDTTAGVMEARNIFLASGKGDLRGWHRPKHLNSRLIGLKMHFRLSPEQAAILHEATELLFFRGGYAGIELVENRTANLCLLVDRDVYKSAGGDWDQLLKMLVKNSTLLGERLAGATPLWDKPLAVYGMPYGYVFEDAGQDKNLYRLGDQMAVIPSFAGDGMAMALHSAQLAARCYLNGTGAGAYHRQARQDFKIPVRLASFLARIALLPYMQPILPQLGAFFPGVVGRAAGAIRFNPKLA